MIVGKTPRRFYGRLTTSSTTAGQVLCTIPYIDYNSNRTCGIRVRVRGYRGGLGWFTELANAIVSTAFVGAASSLFSVGTSLGTLSTDDAGATGVFTVKVTPGSATSTVWRVEVEIYE